MEAVHDLTEHDLDEQKTDDMRQEIDCTRASLADKVEALEHSVMGTVQSAQETVEDSIQIAKNTVATVKRTFDIQYQVEQHPWAMVGGCFLAGLALVSLFPKGRQRSRQAPERPLGNGSPMPWGVEGGESMNTPLPADLRGNSSFATVRPSSEVPSRSGVFDLFHEEIVKVKGIAIGYVMGLVRDSIKESAPQLASQLDSVINGVTTKLGGEPVPSGRQA
jgi:hypothetical protein